MCDPFQTIHIKTRLTPPPTIQLNLTRKQHIAQKLIQIDPDSL